MSLYCNPCVSKMNDFFSQPCVVASVQNNNLPQIQHLMVMMIKITLFSPRRPLKFPLFREKEAGRTKLNELVA